MTAPKNRSGKADRRLARDVEKMRFAGLIASDFKDIAVELIRASQANPLIGIAVSLITVDVLSRIRIIDNETKQILFALVGAAGGVDIAKDFLGIFGIGTAAQDVIRPTPTTLTHAESEKPSAVATTGAPVSDAMVASALGLVSKLAAAA